jgi:replication-associated recombination protein RarA
MAVSDLISSNHAQGRLAAPAPLAFPADGPRDALGPKASFVPVPPTLFTGRRQAAARLLRALGRVPMAIVYGVAGVGKSALGYACAAAFPGPVCYLQAEAERTLPALVRDLFRRAAFDRVGPTEEDGGEACGAALADALEERGTLLVLDDVDRLPPSALDAFLRALGERLRRGRGATTRGSPG